MSVVVWTQSANDSLRDHITYLQNRSPAAAGNAVRAITRAVGRLAEQPFIGRPGRWEGTRELVIDRYPYIVAYRFERDIVEVLYVHHTRRVWPDEPTGRSANDT